MEGETPERAQTDQSRHVGADLFAFVAQEVRRLRPALLVLDGLRVGIRMSSEQYMDHTAFFDRLAALLEFADCTAILSTLAEPGVIAPEHAMADGLVELRHTRQGRRSVRELAVWKLRGSSVIDGSHVFEIDERGVVIYPRTESAAAILEHTSGKTGPGPREENRP